MRIALDPGHGGPDDNNGGTLAGGCYMQEGYSEDDWTLAFARVLQTKLIAADFDCWLIRTTDVSLSRSERNAAAANADLVLSIHVNSIDAYARGLMLFRWPGNRRTLRLSLSVLKYCPRFLRRSRHNNFVVTRLDWTRCAHRVVSTYTADCLLVEVGFASNKMDLEHLMSSAGREELACGLVAALIDYQRDIGERANAAYNRTRSRLAK